MYKRQIEARAREALTDTPVVTLLGPRRAGKTTLARRIVDENTPYFTLDEQSILDAARFDPIGFLRGKDRAVIDEVQRAPELLLALKKSVDEDYRPGRFILTGSANLLTLPRISESLAGRMEILDVLPLSQIELRGNSSTFLERLFAADFSGLASADIATHDSLISDVLTGGFPEMVARPSQRRKRDWANAYLRSVLSRDLLEIIDIEKIAELPAFVRLLAEHAGQLTNFSEFGSSIGVTHKTSRRYLTALTQIFLVGLLPAWSGKERHRLIRTPKLHFLDTGLLAALRGITAEKIENDRKLLGPLLETFVVSECMKLITADGNDSILSHYRDQRQREVDLVVEQRDGRIAGINVKAGATIRNDDFIGLRALMELSGSRFCSGIVLYRGDHVIPFGEKMLAVPLHALWN